MNKTVLSTYDNSWYDPGASKFKILLWMVISSIFFKNSLSFSSGLKSYILKMFGGKVGENVVLKPNVMIKYPWKLVIGSDVWIGEYVWIDNLCEVQIGDNVCISQGAMLLTGNHNYKKSSFDLMVKEITLEAGSWVGTKSIVCPGVTCKSHSVLAVNSVATKNLEEYSIYQGNPAVKVKSRDFIL